MTSLAKGTVKIFIQTLSSKPFEGKVISLVASVDDTIENIKAKIHEEEVRSSSLVHFLAFYYSSLNSIILIFNH